MKRLLFLGLFLSSLGILVFGNPKTMAAFRDVSSSHPSRTAIDYVQQEEIVSGYPDGSFQPDRELNRAEFTKIIIESRFDDNVINTCLRKTNSENSQLFSDVSKDIWFEKYVCVAKDEQIINGYPDGTFRPTQTIIFAEAAKIITASYGLRVGAGDPWYAPYIEVLQRRNAIAPSLLAIQDPLQQAIKPLSRAEMAELIYRLRNIDDEVGSDDGTMSLRVPDTALPRGIDRDEIAITKLEGEEKPIEDITGAPMVFYRLEPNGTDFNEPVPFTIETPLLNNTIPVVFLVSDDGFEMISSPIINIDQQRQTAYISGELNHFSDLAIGGVVFSVSDIALTPPGNQATGSSFSATASISREHRQGLFRDDLRDRELTIIPEWNISSGFKDPSGKLIAGSLTEPPRSLSGIDTATTLQRFNCPKEDALGIQLELEARLSLTALQGENRRRNLLYLRSHSKPFDCIRAELIGNDLDMSTEEESLYTRLRLHAFNQINRLRQENGIFPLTLNSLLNNTASIHAKDLGLNIKKLSHRGSLGEESYTRIKEGRVIDFESNEYRTVPIPDAIARSGQNIGVRNLAEFDGDFEKAIDDFHAWIMTTGTAGVTHRTTMLSTNIPFSEIGLGFYVDESNNLWIVQNFISVP